jgi:hypothetical protein
MNRSYLNLLMLKSESQSNPSKQKKRIRAAHATLSVLWVMTAFLTLLSSASAQADFTLQAAPFSPDALAPGGTSSSNITIGAINGFSSTVDLTCQVSSPQTTTSTPSCAVSPTTVTPPASATATITTTGQTTTVGYAITITGTGPATMHTTPPQNLTVLAVTPQFTITVQNPVEPGSVPAGSGGQGVIVINPVNGYSSPTRQIGGKTISGITLSCASITPLVTIPPVCSFSYPSGDQGVPVNGVPATSTLTINTYGPIITGAIAPRRSFYALWLPLPMLALVGLGAAVGGKRSRKAWALLALFVMSGALFLMPACGNTTTTTTTPNGVTPNNTYTFTVVGVDADGVISSNTTSTTSANPTVTLTVTSPTN